MPKLLSQRHRLILEAFLNCGRSATIDQIAAKTGFEGRGLAHSIHALHGYLQELPLAKHGLRRWRLLTRKLPRLSKHLWAKLNVRRIELIDKEEKRLTQAEEIELEDLQRTAGRRRLDVMSLKPILRRLRRVEKQLVGRQSAESVERTKKINRLYKKLGNLRAAPKSAANKKACATCLSELRTLQEIEVKEMDAVFKSRHPKVGLDETLKQADYLLKKHGHLLKGDKKKEKG